MHWFEVQGQWTTRSCHSRSAASSSLRIGSGGIGIGLKDIVIGLALSLQACRCWWLSNSSEVGQVGPLKRLGFHFCVSLPEFGKKAFSTQSFVDFGKWFLRRFPVCRLLDSVTLPYLTVTPFEHSGCRFVRCRGDLESNQWFVVKPDSFMKQNLGLLFGQSCLIHSICPQVCVDGSDVLRCLLITVGSVRGLILWLRLNTFMLHTVELKHVQSPTNFSNFSCLALLICCCMPVPARYLPASSRSH